MQEFLPFIIIGLATGAVYGLAGIGLVLTYKTSGIFNFGYGAVAALVAFVFYWLTELGLPWGAAAAISVLVCAPIMGLLLELMARTLAGANETIKVVATVGLILIVTSIGGLWHPTNPPTFPPFLPQETVRIIGVNVTWEQIILFAFSAVAAAALYWYFRAYRSGIVMRGVVDNSDLVAMNGDDPVLVRRRAWIIGSIFAGIAGLFVAPTQLLDGATLTTLIFAAFGAAAIGYFTNLPLTFVGGLLVGVAGALVTKYSATLTWVGGLAPALPFIVLFIVLIVLPRNLLVQRRLAATFKVRDTYYAPPRVRIGAGVIAIALLAVIPIIQEGKVTVWSAALINMMLFLSLGLLVRRSGQISLCHLAFAAVGAAAFGHFAGQMHIPWLLAMLLSALVAIPVGAIIAIPAVRVSGVFLALATLGFGVLMEQAFYTRGFMFGQSTLGLDSPRPDIQIGSWDLSSDTGFYYVLLIFAVLTVLVLTAISRGRLGRLLEAMADSPLALETHGATTSVLKVIVFCVTASLAAIAGALEGQLYHFGIGTYFSSFSSLVLVALVVIITAGEPWYAILAAVGFSVMPAYISGQTTTNVMNLLFGFGAVTAAHATQQGTMPLALRYFFDKLGGRRPLAVDPNIKRNPKLTALAVQLGYAGAVVLAVVGVLFFVASGSVSTRGDWGFDVGGSLTLFCIVGGVLSLVSAALLAGGSALMHARKHTGVQVAILGGLLAVITMVFWVVRIHSLSSNWGFSAALLVAGVLGFVGQTVASLPGVWATMDVPVAPPAPEPPSETGAGIEAELVKATASAEVPKAGAGEQAHPAKAGLSIKNVSVRFGGVHAVNDVSFDAPAGRITGLIGPNGAGKTTTFNAVSGLNKPTSGTVTLHEKDISHEGTPRRARLGLGRTFQRTELFNSLTVRQNIAMGREASMAGANPLGQLVGSRKSSRSIKDAVEEAISLTGISAIADTQVGLLSIGQRRLVELARTIAGPFDMLLLDEPSSGLDGNETELFGEVLKTVVRERGCGILLVEHDMTLVRAVCDYVYVLEFGQLIFEGTTEEMANSPIVRTAYLGGSDLSDEPGDETLDPTDDHSLV